MEDGARQNMAQAQMASPLGYRVFNGVFAGFFAVIVLLAVFLNPGTLHQSWWLWLLLCALLGAGAVFAFGLLLQRLPDIPFKVERVLVPAALVLFAVLQAAIGWNIRTIPNDAWDFGAVYSRAEARVAAGTLPDEYFLIYPNNIALYTFFCGYFSIFRLFGATSFVVPAMALNILAINGALVMLYFTARRLFGVKRAVFVLGVSFLTLPFLLYAPIFYTDTLTLPFPMGMVMLWLQARSLWRKGEVRGALVRFGAVALLAALGGLLKLTVLIVGIAIALDFAILLRGRWRLRLAAILAGCAVAVGLFLGLNAAMKHSPLLPDYDYDAGVPKLTWVMMGLSGEGGYNDADYKLILEQEGMEARRQTARQEISRRLDDLGFFGMAGHLADKLAYTFGDGTYFAASKLDRSAAQGTPLQEWFVFSGKYFKVTHYASFLMEMAMLAAMALAAFRAVRSRNNALTFMRLAIFGLVLFLLIWETRSRYLVNFLPLFLLCGLEGVPQLRVARRRVLAMPRSAQRVAPAFEMAPLNTTYAGFGGGGGFAPAAAPAAPLPGATAQLWGYPATGPVAPVQQPAEAGAPAAPQAETYTSAAQPAEVYTAVTPPAEVYTPTAPPAEDYPGAFIEAPMDIFAAASAAAEPEEMALARPLPAPAQDEAEGYGQLELQPDGSLMAVEAPDEDAPGADASTEWEMPVGADWPAYRQEEQDGEVWSLETLDIPLDVPLNEAEPADEPVPTPAEQEGDAHTSADGEIENIQWSFPQPGSTIEAGVFAEQEPEPEPEAVMWPLAPSREEPGALAEEAPQPASDWPLAAAGVVESPAEAATEEAHITPDDGDPPAEQPAAQDAPAPWPVDAYGRPTPPFAQEAAYYWPQPAGEWQPQPAADPAAPWPVDAYGQPLPAQEAAYYWPQQQADWQAAPYDAQAAAPPADAYGQPVTEPQVEWIYDEYGQLVPVQQGWSEWQPAAEGAWQAGAEAVAPEGTAPEPEPTPEPEPEPEPPLRAPPGLPAESVSWAMDILQQAGYWPPKEPGPPKKGELTTLGTADFAQLENETEPARQPGQPELFATGEALPGGKVVWRAGEHPRSRPGQLPGLAKPEWASLDLEALLAYRPIIARTGSEAPEQPGADRVMASAAPEEAEQAPAAPPLPEPIIWRRPAAEWPQTEEEKAPKQVYKAPRDGVMELFAEGLLEEDEHLFEPEDDAP